MSEPIFTIGHFTRTFAEFAELLCGSGVQLIVDVRKLPRSTRSPQFDQDSLWASLGDAAIGYQYAQGSVALLKSEGVAFQGGRVDLARARYPWDASRVVDHADHHDPSA